MPLEQQDDVAPGRGACQADRLGVGLRGGQGELPMRLPRVATSELLGDEDRLLGREEELGRASHPLLDGSNDRRVRVAAEHRHVARVEIDVVVAVHVGERGAVATVHVDRQIVVRGHPRHRCPVRHVRLGAGQELKRLRPLGAEPRELGVVQLADPVPIEVAQRGHVGGGYPRTRTPTRRATVRGEDARAARVDLDVRGRP